MNPKIPSMKILTSTLTLLIMPFCLFAMENNNANPPIEKIELTKAEWKKRLTPEQFKVLRQHDTEAPNSSPLATEHRKGTYLCAGCELPLFTSEMKFESGTGWPSFFAVIPGHVETKRDWSLIIPRTEYHCTRCGGHQGHLFKDGPPPSGLRYCNNGVALKFIPEEK